jgi:hypothetical protein
MVALTLCLLGDSNNQGWQHALLTHKGSLAKAFLALAAARHSRFMGQVKVSGHPPLDVAAALGPSI